MGAFKDNIPLLRSQQQVNWYSQICFVLDFFSMSECYWFWSSHFVEYGMIYCTLYHDSHILFLYGFVLKIMHFYSPFSFGDHTSKIQPVNK